jgi:predicted ATP-grasp superfamily ATP-dependent carboligase
MNVTPKLVSAKVTIAELLKQAVEYERQAEHEPEPAAAKLNEQAKQCRDWARALKRGLWVP